MTRSTFPLKHRPIGGALALVAAVCVLTLTLVALRGTAQAFTALAPPPRSSYLYRFDPASQTFVTFTLPFGGVPHGIAVSGTNPTHVWVALFGMDQIGHLVYTSTSDYTWTTHTLASGSGPFRVAVQGNEVWFTARGANQIGRLKNGQIDVFTRGLSSNAGLADIRVAPNGWVWVAESATNRVGRLVVTATADYHIREYAHATMRGVFGLSIPASEYVWFASPGAGTVGRIDVANDIINDVSSQYSFPWCPNPYPHEVVVQGLYVWSTDPRCNAIGQLEAQTMANLKYYTPTAQPAGLASESTNVLWFTEQGAQGAIGRFTYTSPVSTRFDTFALPETGLRPTGIAVAQDKGVWFAAFTPVRTFLPLVMKNF